MWLRFGETLWGLASVPIAFVCTGGDGNGTSNVSINMSNGMAGMLSTWLFWVHLGRSWFPCRTQNCLPTFSSEINSPFFLCMVPGIQFCSPGLKFLANTENGFVLFWGASCLCFCFCGPKGIKCGHEISSHEYYWRHSIFYCSIWCCSVRKEKCIQYPLGCCSLSLCFEQGTFQGIQKTFPLTIKLWMVGL